MQPNVCSSTLRLANLTQDLNSSDERSRSNAYRDILDMANQQNSDAMFQIARCLNHGIGVEPNHEKADHWLRLACVTQPASKVACYTLGLQHLMKQRTDSDVQKGLSFIERAATSGYVRAIVKLVSVLEKGTLDIKPDLRRAYRLLANSINTAADEQLYQAYVSFVERNQPIGHLLDS